MNMETVIRRAEKFGFVAVRMHGYIQADPIIRLNQLYAWLPNATRNVINVKLRDAASYKGYHTDPAWTHLQVQAGVAVAKR